MDVVLTIHRFSQGFFSSESIYIIDFVMTNSTDYNSSAVISFQTWKWVLISVVLYTIEILIRLFRSQQYVNVTKVRFLLLAN